MFSMCGIFILYPHISYPHFSTIHHCWRSRMMARIAIAIFSWTNLSKWERCNEGNPMQSTNPLEKARRLHQEKNVPYSFQVWVLQRLLLTTYNVTLKMQEMGPTANSRYPRRLEGLIICRCILQRQRILFSYFKILSVGPVWSLNPQPSTQQTV